VARSLGLRAAAETYEWTLLGARTGNLRARLPGGKSCGYLPHAVFSADGRRFGVIGDDYVVRVWDLPIRRPWGLALVFAAVPPAVVGFLVIAARLLRCLRIPRSPLAGAV
jgi:hypothetical protein